MDTANRQGVIGHWSLSIRHLFSSLIPHPSSLILFILYPLSFILASEYTLKSDSTVFIDPVTYLYGNIKFVKGNIIVTAEKGAFTKDSVIVWDNLKIRKDSLLIWGGIGKYFWDEIYIIEKGVNASQGEESLIANSGKLIREKDEIVVNDSCCYRNGKIVITGDKGYYNLKTRSGIMEGNARFFDETDTIEVFSHTISVSGDSLSIATGNTILNQREITVKSDTLWYYPNEDRIVFVGNPTLFGKEDTLSGRKIQALLKSRELKEIVVDGEVGGKRCGF